MAEITIKQNKKGTFLDLSGQNIDSDEFRNNFLDFRSKSAEFLSGSSIGLILPEVEDQRKTELLDFLQLELNKINISINHAKSVIDEAFETESDLDTQTQSADKEVIDTSALPETLYVEANLRSGQLIKYPGNVFVLGDVNPSAEIIAGGDIIVMGSLRGFVHAGVDGKEDAKVICTNFATGQVRIANHILAITDIDKSKNKKKDGYVLPLIAKIEKGEIIITRYFN